MTRPTVYLVLDYGYGDPYHARSAITRAASGEILETVDWDESGDPLWDDAGVCDHRGMAGPEGYEALARALDALEQNARLGGLEVERVEG
jgi:hypothetical protein